MPSTSCVSCNGQRPAALVRPKTSEPYCKQCFFDAFEREIHETIVKEQLFKPGETIAIAASGGKGNRKQSEKNNIIVFIRIRFDSTCTCDEITQ